MPANDDLIERYATQARTSIENADRWAHQLQAVITYIRTDHVGMIHGDGELTRYINFLTRQICEQASYAVSNVKAANIPEEVPF